MLLMLISVPALSIVKPIQAFTIPMPSIHEGWLPVVTTSVPDISALTIKIQTGRRKRRSNGRLRERKRSDSTPNDIEEADDGFDAWDEETPVPGNEKPLDFSTVSTLTMAQLKQQLRLRGLKVSGRKMELVERLVRSTGGSVDNTWGDDDNRDEEKESYPGDDHVGNGNLNNVQVLSKSEAAQQHSRARKFAQERGKQLIDVTAYLEDEDVGKTFKSSTDRKFASEQDQKSNTDDDENAADNAPMSNPEVWGSQARIIDDYEGRKLVVDSLTETLIEYVGSNQTYQQALVFATRDALKPFLAGGTNANNTSIEESLRQVQIQRENAAKRRIHIDDTVGVDEGDETRIFEDILHRDFSDWGIYTPTGAQLSAAEVQGVLLLTDVYGAFTDDNKALAEKIAFECQPVIVMVPDLFQGNPWVGPTNEPNGRGQTYEGWRSAHSDLQTSINIRAAAACLRERYGVSSVVVWGTCYGGGRALEAASGWLPEDGNIHDIDGSVGPPLVDPMAVIAWYPTRYNAQELFGSKHKGSSFSVNKKSGKYDRRKMAVMAIFAGNDHISGATPDDAKALKSLLEMDDRVVDHMVKVFPNQNHGFAHVGLSRSTGLSDDEFQFNEDDYGSSAGFTDRSGDAEVACLLSTAFMETYSRVFLPTIGPPISLDESEHEWGKSIEMKDVRKSKERNVRVELDAAANNFIEEPLGGYRIDPTDPSQDEELARLLRSMQDPNIVDGPYKIQPDDDLPTIYAKLTASNDFEIF